MAVRFMRRSDNTIGSIPEDNTISVSVTASIVDASVFVAPGPCEVVGVSEVHTVAGNDAGAVTLDVKKCTGTQAPSAGTSVLSSTFDLKGTANTVVDRTLTSTASVRKLVAGDRLAVDVTGTPTAVAGGVVTIRLKRLQTNGADR